jgi:DNA repair exonuclease SbcCD nuclease subunit
LKLAILGDFHFGYDRFYEDSFNQAEIALKKAEENSDVLLIAGDIFDTKTPKPEVMGKTLEIFSKIKKPIFVIHGTHERRPKGFFNPIDILVKAGMVNSCHLKPTYFEKEGDKIMIYGMGGVPEEYSKVAIEKLNPKPVEDVFSIFMFHQNIKEFMPPVEHGLFIEDLPDNFNLYVGGHLHKNYEIQKGEKHLIIPGSTVLTQLKKEEKVKGFYIFDTKTKEKQFMEIPSRKFYYLEFESENEDDIIQLKQKIIEKINTINFENKPILRLCLLSPVDSNVILQIKEMYSDKCYLFISSNKKELDEKDLVDELEKDFENEMSVRQKGMNILKEVLSNNDYKGINIEEFFDFLCECDEQEMYEKYFEVIK